MNDKKILDTIYPYLVFYKNGFTINDILDNREIFLTLCDELVKERKSNCDVNIKFVIAGKECFEIKTSANHVDFQIELKETDFDLLTQLLFGQIKCSDFLYKNSRLINNEEDFLNIEKTSKEALASWEKFIERIGYKEDDFFVSDETYVARKMIDEENILWCYNKSCTGKTFLGIYTLTYCNYSKYVYNPSVENTCDINFLKLLVEYGLDCALLIDDLQCDVEFAKKLLEFICMHKLDIKNRNIHIFLISWSSLVQASDFMCYKEALSTIETKPKKFINMMKDKLNNQELVEICEDNLALISAALRLERKRTRIDNNKAELFRCFVQTTDEEQLKLIHILAVLGTYEFETPLMFIKHFGTLRLQEVIPAKVIGSSIFLAHRTISNFIARYIENECLVVVYERKEIIKRYINYIDNRKKWKALIHLIGENNQSDVLSVSPLWNLMYEFQNNLKRQTSIDPSWKNTPSSMYFVISTAKMLGVVEEYRNVIEALCANFILDQNQVVIKYDDLQTTFDFIKIKERMIEEDEENEAKDYESGKSIDLEMIHKNWLYGLMMGLKNVLIDFGHKDLINRIEIELLQNQESGGFWYPKRVLWVTARILIGLTEAGYTIKDDFIKKGVEYLISSIKDEKWEAHTGGWNNVFETSSLCLEALIKCGVDCENGLVNDVVNYLLRNSQMWMLENNEIDGATTACSLLKIIGIQDSLLSYVNELAKRNIHNIVDMTRKLDYENVQSCKTTQIAYYVIELCWYILEKDIANLLDDFIVRSELEMDGGKMNNIQIFISYSEDSPYHIKKIEKIVDYLEKEGYIVYFYAKAPLGTNNMEFMQKINKCDATIVIGTKKYKEKSTGIRAGGVFFEACVLSREFMNSNYEKIIPIAFDEFSESFPEPFAVNKGMRVKRVDQRFLKNLAAELKNKF